MIAERNTFHRSTTTIAFLLNSLEFGGAQRVFIDDANDFARAGYTVFFYVLYGRAGEYPFGKELGPAVRTVFLNARSPFDLSAVRRCESELRRSGAQVLFSTLNDGNIFARWVALMSGSRIRLVQREANAPSSKTFMQKALDVLLSWVPHRILALSHETRDSLTCLLPFARRKITLLPNAVTIPVLDRSQSLNPVPVIFSVGRFTYQKNYELLIAALGRLARSGVPFTATIAGAGQLRDTLETQVQKEGLEGKITFLGTIAHEEVLKRYATADLFVLPSRWEGSPNVILEAMAYGLPVVATSVGGVRDIIIDGKEGLLVPSDEEAAMAEALGKLLTDAGLRQQLGAAARQRVGAFSREIRFSHLRAIVNAL